MSLQQLLSQAAQAEQNNEWDEAAKLYEEALKQSPHNQPAKEKLGWCLSRAGKHQQAIPIFRELFESQPQDAKWPYMVGYQYYYQEQWLDAIQWFEQALSLNPQYVVVLYRKGYAHFKSGQIGQALQAFERCRLLWQALPDGPVKEKDKKNCAKAAYHQAEVLIENPRRIEGALKAAIPILNNAIHLALCANISETLPPQ